MLKNRFFGFLAILFVFTGVKGQDLSSVHYFVDSTKELSIERIQDKNIQSIFNRQPLENSNFGFDNSSYWFKLKIENPSEESVIVEVEQNSLDSITLYQKINGKWYSETLGHNFDPRTKKYSDVNYAFELSPEAQEDFFYLEVNTSGTVAVPISVTSFDTYSSNKTKRTLFLGVFFGLMLVMAIYNLLLYTYLRDKAYLLYVGATTFGLITSFILNGYGYRFIWPDMPGLDNHIYLTFAGLSMVCSSRFAATFLNLKQYDPRMNNFLWVVAGASLLMVILSIFYDARQLLLYGRLLVLIAFPSYIIIGIRNYLRGYKTAIYYIFAWVPYILGLVLVTLRGAGLVPEMIITAYGIEIGGASEAVLLSLALAARIKGMRKQLIEKELEKERFMTQVLSEQKSLLEKTVEERTKELQTANETKDKFFSIIAHDLRSPMISLQGVGEKLEYFIRKDKYDKLLELGTKIDYSIDQLNHLLNNLLNWAASQAGGVPHNPCITNLKELIDENIQLYHAIAKTKGVRLVNNADDAEVYADINTISTVIRNLLSNAIKFSPQGERVILEISINEKDVELSIKDYGRGMTPGMLEDVLSNNLPQSVSGTRGEKGFGLGLKLCKEFVVLNQGTLSVESEPGKGTRFIVTLPARP
ncbi:sensor histidine kinase [Roseivirga sp.]|uniref:sensor histidine kinase n=1 Tax=Roseivirga sp. TaxID=1964215 RepID=UPI003B51E578